MQCSRSSVAAAACRGSRWLASAGGPPPLACGLGAAPFSSDAQDSDAPPGRRSPSTGRGRGSSTGRRFTPQSESGVRDTSRPQPNIHPVTLARRQAALGSRDPGVPEARGHGRGRGGEGAVRANDRAQSSRRGRILSDTNAFAALQSGQSQGDTRQRTASRERRGQRGEGRPRSARRPGGRSVAQQQFPQFEDLPTFGEVHFEKELLAQIYAEKDKTLHFQLGMPKPWEDVKLPNAEERWRELDDYLEGMKEELLAPLKEDEQAQRFARLEGEGEGGGEAKAVDATGDEQASQAAAGSDKPGASMIRPGAEAELIKPVDMELEETWEYLKEHALMQVVSQEHDDRRKELKKGESWMGGKQQDRLLASLVEEANVDDQLRATLEKYQAVLERNSHWKFMDRYNVLKKATAFLEHAPR